MRNLVTILECVAVIAICVSAPATIAVRRLVIPYRKRLRRDGTRTDNDRVIDVQVGPIHIIDKPAEKP